jgi:hypothetical protein
MERARLSRDVRRLRRRCKVRVLERRPPLLGLAPARPDFGAESDRLGGSSATAAGADARTRGRREGKVASRIDCVEAEEGGEGCAASDASSPLVSVSVLSEPASDSPSKWLLSDRHVAQPPFPSALGAGIRRRPSFLLHTCTM